MTGVLTVFPVSDYFSFALLVVLNFDLPLPLPGSSPTPPVPCFLLPPLPPSFPSPLVPFPSLSFSVLIPFPFSSSDLRSDFSLNSFIKDCLYSYRVKKLLRTSLVAQWLGIRLPVRGTRVQALVREDPTYRRATKPMRHNY